MGRVIACGKQLLCVATASMVLAGCGGGGGGDNPPQQTTPLQTQTTSVATAPSVPASAVALVDEVSTSTDAGTLAKALSAPADKRVGSDLTLAVNASNEIVLASAELPTAGRIELSARSTATALVRLAQGTSQGSGPALNSAIEAAPGFAGLESAIQEALNRAVAPAGDPIVLQALVTVLNDVSGAVQSSKSPLRARALSLPAPRIEDTPFTLVSKGLGAGSVKLTGAGGSGVVGRNDTVIHWSASANSLTVAIEPSSNFSLPDAGGSPFPLTLEQTVSTRELNANATVRVVAVALLGFLPGTDVASAACGKTVGKLLLKSEELDHAVAQGDPSAWLAYFADLQSKLTALDIGKLYLDCYGTAAPASYAATARRFVASLTFLKAIDQLKATIKVATALQTFSQTVAYWSESAVFGVCQDKLRAIRSCAAEFTASEELVLIPGASTTPTYEAHDAGGTPTGLAAGLTFETTNASFLLVNPPDGRISGFRPGIAAIRVREPVTEVMSDIPVRIVTPRIDPQIVRAQKDAGILLRFIDPQGASLITEGASVTWTVSNPAIVTIQTDGSGGATLKALAEGTATVSAKLAVSGETVTAEVQVGGTVFEGPISLSGPAVTAGTCTGTYAIVGTVTVETAGAPFMRVVGTETIDQTCYRQSSNISVTVPLTANAGRYTAAVSYPFTCAPPCFSGKTDISVDLSFTTVLGQSPYLRGPVTWVNSNQTPFRGEATGNVDIALRAPAP
jgi:hypothetical protein